MPTSIPINAAELNGQPARKIIASVIDSTPFSIIHIQPPSGRRSRAKPILDEGLEPRQAAVAIAGPGTVGDRQAGQHQHRANE